jgi:hypothetical protein
MSAFGGKADMGANRRLMGLDYVDAPVSKMSRGKCSL